MEYQTEEQQVEQLKEWWKENGTPLIIGAVLGLSGFFGWKYLGEKQEAYMTSASDLYITVTEQLEKDDNSQLVANANAVKEQFGDTSYAILSAFQLAKIAIEKNDLEAAAGELKWVISNHQDNELASIANIRLARILIAQQKAEEALTLLTFDSESGYFEVASVIKGDALVALGKNAEALEAYKAADNIAKSTANHPTLKLAIDSLTAAALSQVSEENLKADGESLEPANALEEEDSEVENSENSSEQKEEAAQ